MAAIVAMVAALEAVIWVVLAVVTLAASVVVVCMARRKVVAPFTWLEDKQLPSVLKALC